MIRNDREAVSERLGLIMKKLISLLLIAVVILSPTFYAQAEETGKTYTYNHRNEAVPIPSPYEVSAVLGGDKYGFGKPQDMMIRNEELYVLDAESQRVIVLDQGMNVVRKVGFSKDGGRYELAEPKGIWVDAKGNIFVADRSKKMVFQANAQGVVEKEYGKPQNDLIDEKADYLPKKVMTDHLGQIYVLVENEYRGMMTFNPQGDFLGFFGSQEVAVDAELLIDMVWRKFMTEEQRQNTRRYLPVEYSNMTIDSKGCVYVCSAITESMTELVRKLNLQGTNILQNKGRFGDYNLGVSRGTWFFTNYNSIAVDNQGFITVLDSTWNRLFQYSNEGELLYVFGGKGAQSGTFGTPVDVECMGDKLLVLDSQYGNITVYTPTSFGSSVRKAEQLYQNGLFTESIEPWQEVLRQNSNYEFAYVGIGKALMVDKDYKAAMEYFKLGYSHTNYSIAFKRYRSIVLRENFSLIMVALIFLFVLLPLGISVLKRKGIVRNLVLDESGKLKYTMYIMVHPSEGYQELRYNQKYSLGIANGILILWFFVSALSYSYKGFIFNYNDPNDFNVFVILISTIGLVFIFCLVNWLLATFFEGKGSFRSVWIYTCYALLPLSVASGLQILLSHVMSADEGVFLGYLITIGSIWTAALLLFSNIGVHQYSFKMCVASLAATLLGMVVIVFLFFMMCNLYIQVESFFKTIIKEILYRMKT